jgi:NAD(P)-dependent dehydrogenase (short-subunit alcohol dehydrogenase family)
MCGTDTVRTVKDYIAPSNLLQDRVILVTGAGQGLGRVAALAYAAHGATVILHGRDERKLEAVYDEIEEAGGPQPVIHPLDMAMADDEDYEALAQAIRSQFGRLDGILHNAGAFYTLSPLQDQTQAQWLHLLKTNLVAPFALTRACFPLLRSVPDGSVILTGDSRGVAPAAYWGGYAVAKSGLQTFLRIAAEEWEMHPNLRINLMIPGPVKSPQRNRSHPGEDKSSLPAMESLLPYYLFLIGPDSKGYTGKMIEAR